VIDAWLPSPSCHVCDDTACRGVCAGETCFDVCEEALKRRLTERARAST
jgi:hypothetical protein